MSDLADRYADPSTGRYMIINKINLAKGIISMKTRGKLVFC